MKNISVIVSGLLLSITVSLGDSIYDGSGSLISPTEDCWGCDKDEARMHPHNGKTSTVSFQWLKNPVSCNHIDIHTDKDLGQDVQINVKSWHEDSISESYETRLPVGKYYEPKGVSISANNAWTTLSITTKQPINESVSIYAYCRGATDKLMDTGLNIVSTEMTELDKKHYYFGNASLISTASNGEGGNFGTERDLFVTSSVYDAEGIFQVQSSKECKKIRIYDENNEKNVEEILMKGWSEEKWKETDCAELPCTLNVHNQANGDTAYTLINVKTKANQNSKIYAVCDTSPITIDIKEKELKPKHPNNCQFTDVPTTHERYVYITAFCSAQIVEGYGPSYEEFGPENTANWAELTKVVNLSANYYKTKKTRDRYSISPWYKAYTDLAIEQGFNYIPALQVTRGLAYRYIVKVFWNKNLSESESARFLSDKGISYLSNTSILIKRGYMAEIILKSSKISSDESAIERKLPYINRPPKPLASPPPAPPIPLIWNEPKETDTPEKRKETIDDNIKTTMRENTTVSVKGQTDNTGLVKQIVGGEENINTLYKDKKASEILVESTAQGVNIPVSAMDKILENPLYWLTKTATNESFLVTTSKEKDDKGNHKFVVETSPQKVEVMDRETLEENGIEVKAKIEVESFMKRR
jgi:hypothetical protein